MRKRRRIDPKVVPSAVTQTEALGTPWDLTVLVPQVPKKDLRVTNSASAGRVGPVTLARPIARRVPMRYLLLKGVI